jgi:adenylylsulfate kinase-like enzyme
LPDSRFVEIYVKCDLEVLKRRDPKGLYAKALRGEIPEFTGVSSPYEEPLAPEILVETDVQSVDDIVEQVMDELTRRGLLSL